MKQAVIQTGGKQYLVSPGQRLSVERLSGEVGETISFGEVLAVIDGDNTVVGTPTVEKTAVTAEIVEQGRAAKIRVEKFKNKTRFHRVAGHQQLTTTVKIVAIGK